MKNGTKSSVFWVLVGVIVGVVVSLVIMNYSTTKMAPADFRQHNDLDGVLIASAYNVLNVSSTERFFYEPSETFPVSERFTIEMEHKDPGMLINDFPVEKKTDGIITL